jgi:hypothetical protein
LTQTSHFWGWILKKKRRRRKRKITLNTEKDVCCGVSFNRKIGTAHLPICRTGVRKIREVFLATCPLGRHL